MSKFRDSKTDCSMILYRSKQDIFDCDRLMEHDTKAGGSITSVTMPLPNAIVSSLGI